MGNELVAANNVSMTVQRVEEGDIVSAWDCAFGYVKVTIEGENTDYIVGRTLTLKEDASLDQDTLVMTDFYRSELKVLLGGLDPSNKNYAPIQKAPKTVRATLAGVINRGVDETVEALQKDENKLLHIL